MPAKIIIGADLVPTESNYNYFKGCETEYLIGKKITEKLNNAEKKDDVITFEQLRSG